MVSTTESLEFNCLFDYKQLKLLKEDWLYGPLFYCEKSNTTWRIQVDRSNPTNLGIYLTLTDGAPCAVTSYTISTITATKPSLIIFNNKCTQRRAFPSSNFSWGFANFCTRRELRDERHLIRDTKTKLVNVRCTMNIEKLIVVNAVDDHRFATDLFHTCPLDKWIEFLKQRDDLPELSNRVNEEIEARL